MPQACPDDVWCLHLLQLLQRPLIKSVSYVAGAAAWSLRMPKSPSRQLTVTPTPSPTPSTSTSISFSPSLRQVLEVAMQEMTECMWRAVDFGLWCKVRASTYAHRALVILGATLLPCAGHTKPAAMHRDCVMAVSTGLPQANTSMKCPP